MQQLIITGNASLEGQARRGWFMGHFLATGDARSTETLEVKWATHAAGEGRSEWSMNAQATTISILISGRFRLEFADRTAILAKPGDYALWLPGVSHTWLAEEESIVLTIRYPSLSGDANPTPAATSVESE